MFTLKNVAPKEWKWAMYYIYSVEDKPPSGFKTCIFGPCWETMPLSPSAKEVLVLLLSIPESSVPVQDYLDCSLLTITSAPMVPIASATESHKEVAKEPSTDTSETLLVLPEWFSDVSWQVLLEDVDKVAALCNVQRELRTMVRCSTNVLICWCLLWL